MRNKHTLWLLICCLIPLAALGAVYLFHASARSLLFYGLVFLCPALHFVLMRGAMGGHAHPAKQPTPTRVAEPTEEVPPR